MEPVITSLLDTDLYKYTMWQTMLHRFPQTQAEYSFVCRNQPAYPLAELLPQVNAELDALCALSFREDELAYIGGLRYIKSDFVDFLRIFRFQRNFIEARAEGAHLRIVARGPQVHVMAFEIFVLAIVNELYFRRFDRAAAEAEGRLRLQAKLDQLRALGNEAPLRHPFELFDFGVRRRFSRSWQREVVAAFQAEAPQFFKGTSNVLLARDLGLVPIGTMAHEYLQTYQALGVRLRDFQKAALEDWVQEYRGDLGIALTDVVGMDAFLSDFDLYFAKLFDGLRHDSGDPLVWANKALDHYQKLRIDPHTKRLVFSDGLTINKALALYHALGNRTNLGFGIGTHLTNDVGLTPLNIVMKLTSANGQPVAKLSDSPGKTLCDDQTFLAYLRQVFNVSILAEDS
ncbi:MAG TPA: nicotinate phosphoribosyltransferase [Hydrogenophaga sp.]|uniref:nicotinate phosphoribosyltransferase n=1 Tax=Hydrogenophaga sp. TaxID=1904254 RepID=UPI0008AE30BB|nr:nicotinate phosphoribosyltransferase [Hydrogenophaga sp.]OGA76230.1 MAG: nicotinate phosphoribosyltransferase [Burkholderiales bacterium GWE1_65_30]OGA91239.1 MAG: nicotinate phosphoribosyltransferase [Burkholderiales bacterium GWF1_66_17]OGB20062.1 MAG: nicotinate phosphoribosyltransferase [Burkholderiales bacterium RIFCSPHIGHO2_02_FULL_66_10]HAX22210.1 nicotinate phosphoribosyltransferase [Hydrogenophaga sp.]HBU20499.1 nicotinate phosphoribosyltransferase [Hydrogenophaga sp.]